MGSKLFLIFGKNFTERLSELLSTFSKTSWRNRLFHFFFSFRCVIRLWAKLFWHVAQNFPQSCQNWFLRVHTTILMEEKTFLKIDFFFEIWANFFPTFGKKYSANLAELLSKRSDEQYGVQPTTSLKTSSSLSGFWSKHFLNFRIIFLQKCENCFLRTDTNTSIKKIFFEKFSSYFGIRSKPFLALGRNSTERLSELFSTCSKVCWRNRLFHFFSLFVV